MRLAFAEASISLFLSGYQFPDLTPPHPAGEWDADWLVVIGKIHSNGRTGEFRDPCLTAFEAGELGRWLRVISQSGRGDDRRSVTSLDFTEPELAFECALLSDDDAVIRVVFSGGAAHPEDGVGGAGEEARVVTVQMSLADIGLAADEWERECARYPARSTDAAP
ncbi:hypothetical protein ACIRCZ_06585 [Leifsonia sp. NPDC102414]|uniref:WapI family immunity protein n=1 Tax=Leifsonia sp. NPDC102414 TaxID=3364124 RepID=UPI003825D8BB